jgi:elongation factor 4
MSHIALHRVYKCRVKECKTECWCLCSYEVSRSLQACEGALLVVDASQGIEAQTLANVWLAFENDLEIIPVINKIDLPGADPERVKSEIQEIIGIDASNALLCSAKTGVGIDEILEAIVNRVPPPKDTRSSPLRALIFDSFYDQYLGVVCQFRVIDGLVTTRDTITFMNTKKSFRVTDLWARAPGRVDVNCLYAGEVGCVAGAIKSVQVR